MEIRETREKNKTDRQESEVKKKKRRRVCIRDSRLGDDDIDRKEVRRIVSGSRLNVIYDIQHVNRCLASIQLDTLAFTRILRVSMNRPVN